MKKKKRVALLGNMNNNFFNLARYLRDAGFDAHLFIFPFDPQHFQPEADTFDNDHIGYVHYLSWGNPFDLSQTPVETIKKDIDHFEFYITCGTASAYLAKAGIRSDLFIPYGADLYDIPFFKLVRPTKLFHYYTFTKHQRKGIRSAKNISIGDTSDLFKKALSKIRFNGNRHFFAVPMVYSKQYSPETITAFYTHAHYYDAFNTIRKQFDLVIFHHSRQSWKNEPDPVSLKDNDKLFKGLARYLQTSHKSKRIAIIALEYGHDVDASKELCHELGIEQHVFWFPLMPRKELMIGISLSDIVAGEFRTSWFTYGVVFEAMALAKPVMHYRDDSLYREMELYPMLYAKEASDIAHTLEDFIDNKSKLQSIGSEARAWFERNIVKKSMEKIISLLT